MNDELGRSREELAAARLLVDNGFLSASVSRAYYAAFYAAEAALAHLGETRAKHSGVISAFGKLVIKEGGLDPERGRHIRSLFEQRGRADYAEGPASAEDTRASITAAEAFVEAVEGWLGEQNR